MVPAIDGPPAPPARRAGRPSAREADALSQSIVSAALQEFLDRGFCGASIERIARSAKVSRMAVYRRYGDKKTLFETVLYMQVRALEASTSSAGGDLIDPLTELRLTSQHYLEFMISPVAINLQRILIAEASRLPTLSKQVAPPLPQSLGERLTGLIEAAQHAGQLRNHPPMLLREILLRLVAEGPRWEFLMGRRVWSNGDIEAHLEQMWPMFLKIAAA